MANMIVKMSLAVIAYVVVSMIIWLCVDGKKLTYTHKVLIGLVYGLCAILSTHFGIDFIDMMLNVRDLGPLVAGLYFDPFSGVLAGLIGGIERYIAGEFFGVGSYTRVACAVSTALAGVFAYQLNKRVYKGVRPTPASAFFIGAVMEVFHMYAILITHRDDITTAFAVVDVCSFPMILFSAIGLACVSFALISYTDQWEDLFKKKKKEEIPISSRIQQSIFIVMVVLMLSYVVSTFYIQSQTANQTLLYEMEQMTVELKDRFATRERLRTSDYLGTNGQYEIYDNAGRIIYGTNKNKVIDIDTLKYLKTQINGEIFENTIFEEESFCKVFSLGSEYTAIIHMSTSSVFWYRNAQTYESIFYAILMISVMYLVISVIVDRVVVSNIQLINNSLAKITNGNLDEVVNVRNSKEFAILSDDINETVGTLKGYIDKEKQRMKEDIELATSIQMSSLPKNFEFPNHDEFELYAIMDAAKGVGGDFYDFFFVGKNQLALVIADVSGKGVPGSLFMMKAKNIIRGFSQKSISPVEILYKVNNTLCEDNDAEMFVTVWLGIIDLETGIIKCANFGHEYPILMHKSGKNEIYNDPHSLPLAAFEGTKGKEYEIKLDPGDGIFLYTDGVPEAINRQNEAYGMDRLIKVLDSSSGSSMKDVLTNVKNDVEVFANGEDQFDDITLFALRYIHRLN